MIHKWHSSYHFTRQNPAKLKIFTPLLGNHAGSHLRSWEILEDENQGGQSNMVENSNIQCLSNLNGGNRVYRNSSWFVAILYIRRIIPYMSGWCLSTCSGLPGFPDQSIVLICRAIGVRSELRSPEIDAAESWSLINSLICCFKMF